LFAPVAVAVRDNAACEATGLTVTAAVPLTVPLVAFTVAVPAVVPAEYTPALVIAPTPVEVQVNGGCVAKAVPF